MKPTYIRESDLIIGHNKQGLRVSVSDFPRLAFGLAQRIEQMKSGQILDITLMQPEDVKSESYTIALLQTASDYIIGYIDSLATTNPTRARAVADSLQIPWVREVQSGPNKVAAIVEILTVTEYARRQMEEIGKKAGKKVAASIEPKAKASSPKRESKAFSKDVLQPR